MTSSGRRGDLAGAAQVAAVERPAGEAARAAAGVRDRQAHADHEQERRPARQLQRPPAAREGVDVDARAELAHVVADVVDDHHRDGRGAGGVDLPEADRPCRGARQASAPSTRARSGPIRAGGAAMHPSGSSPVCRQLLDHAACLGDDKPSRSPVPGIETALEVSVEAAAGHPGQVDRGRAEAAQVAHRRKDRRQQGRLAGALGRDVAEAGADEGLVERRARAPRAAPGRRGARPPPRTGGEGLAARRVVHHADQRPLGVERRDAHAPLRESPRGS